MAQKSLPWPKGVAADSLVGYTAKEWWAAWALMAQAGGVVVDSLVYSDATLYNRGVFYSAANRLAVTSPGANRINVASGAALVDGAMFYNTASIGAGGDIGSPAANPRIDRVVVRKNFGALPYVPAAASVALFSVPAYTARVTVIHGAENVAPVAPTLQHDTTRATYWDIPLLQYQISVAGAITNLTDERVWADAETKEIVIPLLGGHNDTDAVPLQTDGTSGLVLPDAKTSYVVAGGNVPLDFIGNAVVSSAFSVPSAGDMYSSIQVWYGTCNSATGGTNVAGAAVIPVVDGRYNCIFNLALTTPAAGQVLVAQIARMANDPLDTINDSAYFLGAYLSYLGWR